MKKLILCAICAICGFTAANAQGKFGHVNTQEIIQAMPEFTKAQNEIKALQEQYEADLKSMNDEFQKKLEDYQKNGSTLPDNIKQRREQELQDMDTKIRQSYQDNQQALQKASSEKMQVIQTKVLDAIKAVGQAGGFTYIAEMGTMPYISTTLSTDVTAQVKTKLGLK
jgi:outer membrane protein